MTIRSSSWTKYLRIQVSVVAYGGTEMGGCDCCCRCCSFCSSSTCSWRCVCRVLRTKVVSSFSVSTFSFWFVDCGSSDFSSSSSLPPCWVRSHCPRFRTKKGYFRLIVEYLVRFLRGLLPPTGDATAPEMDWETEEPLAVMFDDDEEELVGVWTLLLGEILKRKVWVDLQTTTGTKINGFCVRKQDQTKRRFEVGMSPLLTLLFFLWMTSF